MEIGFAILLNNEGHNLMRRIQMELQEELGIQASTIVPHITIKSPFETSNRIPFLQYLESLIQEMEPFEITIQGFNHFTDRVIFLEVAENPVLLELHWRILNDVKSKFGIDAHEFEGENIKFHSTVSFFKEKEKFDLAWSYLQQYNLQFSFLAKTLGVYYYLGEKGYIVGHKINFARK